MSTLLIENADISDKVIVSSCVHEMYAGGRADSLHIKISDSAGIFDRWHVKPGMQIEFRDTGISSGKMFLYPVTHENGNYCLRAYSMPSSGIIPNTKVWERVHFNQIGKEIAERNGMEFVNYGIDDIIYEYRVQENETDFKFLGRLCTLEGIVLIIYDCKLIAAYEPYLEMSEPTITLNTSGCKVEIEDNSILAYGSAIVSSGIYTGTFQAQNGNDKVWIPKEKIECHSNSEAIRFAKGVLRDKNKMLFSGSVENSLMSQYAPGIMMNLIFQQVPSRSGAYFIYKVRHDYGNKKTKLFFRKVLEGY